MEAAAEVMEYVATIVVVLVLGGVEVQAPTVDVNNGTVGRVLEMCMCNEHHFIGDRDLQDAVSLTFSWVYVKSKRD